MTIPRNEFVEMIEGDLSALFELRGRATQDPAVEVYLRVLVAYLRFDAQELNRLVDSIVIMAANPGGPEYSIPHGLALARLRIREKQVTPVLLKQLKDLLAPLETDDSTQTESLSRWKGELLFVLAMLQEGLDAYSEAAELFLRASRAFEQQGVFRKSLKALQNSIASQSKASPGKNFTVEYHWIARKALRFGETQVAGVAYNNISHEYQQMGAFRVALSFCNKAIGLLEEGSLGTINHSLAVVHRCHLLMQMGCPEEAEMDYQYALISPFPEIRSALSVVDQMRAIARPLQAATAPQNRDLTFGWKKRASELNQNQAKLTHLEERVVALLLTKTRSRMELVEELYGSGIDPVSGESRLKVLLTRLRKKKPGLVSCSEGRYRLIPQLYPTLRLQRQV